jgi:general nucleoside transport system permease protein
MFHLYLEKRLHQSILTRLGVSAAAVVLALVMGGIFLFASGIDVVAAYQLVWTDVLTQSFGWEDLLVKMTPLLLTGTAVALAAQMKLWNIGAEGQLYLGATASTWVALHLGDTLPMGLALSLMLLAAMTFGGLWAFVPGVLKAQFGVNEIITTLLLNYVAISWVDYLLYGPWRDPASSNFPITREFAAAAQLPDLGSTSIHLGLVFGPVIIAIVYFVLQKTKIGFQIRVAGDNIFAAHYAGFNTARMTLMILVLSGAIAGLAGLTEVAGVHHRLQQHFSVNYGYTGIIVAWLARNHPLAVVPTAFLMAVIFVGAELMQLEFRLPIATVYLFEGIMLFAVLGSEMFTEYHLKVRRIANA